MVAPPRGRFAIIILNEIVGAPDMKRYLGLILAIVLFITIHEGMHALMALAFDEYQAFRVRPYGYEVIFKTPVAERVGVKWGYISGVSNLVTLLLGYLFFACRHAFSRAKNRFIGSSGYWLAFIFMLFDPLNLSLMPFVFGGDISGIVAGFGINRYVVQAIAFLLLLVNRELIIHRLFPAFGVTTKHPLFQPVVRG